MYLLTKFDFHRFVVQSILEGRVCVDTTVTPHGLGHVLKIM